MNKEEIKDWLFQYEIKKYTIHDNLVVDVCQDIWLGNRNLTSFPFQFGVIQGDFWCSNNKLTSLEHCPKIVQGNFYCHHNQLTSLKHCPEIVQGGFYCDGNQLTSLEHCPKIVHGVFWCDKYLEKDIRYLRHYLAKQLQSL